ncbi:MAG: hypothetical protein Q9188_003242 [Gyalolechia gomerana]
MSAGYAGKDVKDLQPAIDKILSAWIRRLEEEWIWKPEQSTDFDIGKRIQFLTVDIITQLCLGDSFQCSENDRDQYGFLETVKSATPISLQMSTFPEFTKIMYHLTKNSTIRRLLVPSIRDKGGIGTVIKATLLSIVTNPQVYNTLQAEIDYAVAISEISFPIQDAEARRLPYLQACILEGLRIHPPLAQLRKRVAPPEGDYMHGCRIPGGTCVGFNSWGTQRDAIYGDNPDIFRPERWLVDDEAKVRQMKRTCDLIFGSGPTKCLGTGIAGMELNKVIFEGSKALAAALLPLPFTLSPFTLPTLYIFLPEDLSDRHLIAVEALRCHHLNPTETMRECVLGDLFPRGFQGMREV